MDFAVYIKEEITKEDENDDFFDIYEVQTQLKCLPSSSSFVENLRASIGKYCNESKNSNVVLEKKVCEEFQKQDGSCQMRLEPGELKRMCFVCGTPQFKPCVDKFYHFKSQHKKLFMDMAGCEADHEDMETKVDFALKYVTSYVDTLQRDSIQIKNIDNVFKYLNERDATDFIKKDLLMGSTVYFSSLSPYFILSEMDLSVLQQGVVPRLKKRTNGKGLPTRIQPSDSQPRPIQSEVAAPAVVHSETACDHNYDIPMETAQYTELDKTQETVNQASDDSTKRPDTTKDYCSAMNNDTPDFIECLPPLCSHTECTGDDVMLMTLALGLLHKLTWVAMVDILQMFNSVFGEKKIKASKFSFKKGLFETKDINVTYHYYCNTCSFYITKSDSSKGDVKCQVCDGVVSEIKKPQYFISLSLESQLKNLLSNEKMAEMMMTYRFTRTKENEANLEDIYDGSEYKKHTVPGKILSFPENFSYSFFTDGVPLGKSKKSLWPIYVSLNELPPKERRNHILLVGLYHGAHDPNQQIFLRPFVEEANKLSNEGFEWTYKSKVMESRIIPLLAVADSVARCQLLNFQTFSSFYGCTFCYQKTKHTKKRLKYVLPNKPIEERTLESTKFDLIEVYKRRHETEEKKRTFRGVKGPSTRMKLDFFSLLSSCVVDYLHNILLGVTKFYFDLVFDSTRRKVWTLLEDDVCAMDDVLSEIDKRLLVIKPPTGITRSPRSIKDCVSWKGNEWRSWLLFYCMPCLIGLMKQKYLIHIAMLSTATSLLLSTSVSTSDVQVAHRLFQSFTFYFQRYFGEEFMYYNIHLLTHVCKGVLRFGPIFTHNAFMYEGFDRQLLHLCKNPYRVVKEVSEKYLAMNALPRLIQTFNLTDDTIFFCEDILDRKLIRFKSCGSSLLLGAGKACYLFNIEEEFLQSNNLLPFDCLFYERMLFNGMRITTAQYALKYEKNDDSFVYSKCDTFYQIRAIIFHAPSKSVHLLAKKIKLSQSDFLSSNEVSVSHISKIHGFGGLVIFTPNWIKGQCVADAKTGMFLSKIPVSYSYGD